MTKPRVLLRRLLGLFDRARRDAELDDETATRLDLHADAHLRAGMSAEDARAAARRELGAIEAMKDAYRDQRGLPWLDALAQDLRGARRALRRDARLSIVVIATFAIGIGANTALFGVVDAVMLAPLPYANPDRLVWISEGRTTLPTLNGADFAAWGAESHSFEMLGALTTQDVTVSGIPAIRVRGLAITEPLGRMLRIVPRQGPAFS